MQAYAIQTHMAIKSTIYKAELQITDIDRHYYADHQLTIAKHPSESDERMVVRLFAFSWFAAQSLQFTKGLSTDDEPDIWQKSLSDEIELWIDLGQPDEKRIRKACGRSKQVMIVHYQQRSSAVWWEQMANKLQRFNNLSVVVMDDCSVQALVKMVSRTMRLQCTIQDGHCWLSNGESSVEVVPWYRKRAAVM